MKQHWKFSTHPNKSLIIACQYSSTSWEFINIKYIFYLTYLEALQILSTTKQNANTNSKLKHISDCIHKISLLIQACMSEFWMSIDIGFINDDKWRIRNSLYFGTFKVFISNSQRWLIRWWWEWRGYFTNILEHKGKKCTNLEECEYWKEYAWINMSVYSKTQQHLHLLISWWAITSNIKANKTTH